MNGCGGEAGGGIADFVLTHDRPIHVRCDDSVTRVIGEKESPIRRSRGRGAAADSICIGDEVRLSQILAVGGQLKGTLRALGRRRASRYLAIIWGIWIHFAAFAAFERDITSLLRAVVLPFGQRWIAHDLHPDYASTRYAERRAAAEGIALVAVQITSRRIVASCLAEHVLQVVRRSG